MADSGEHQAVTEREDCADCDNGRDLLALEICDTCGRSEDYCGMGES